MKNKFNWTAQTNSDRTEIIDRVKNIIQSNKAYIINFHMYSDLALSMMLELKESKISDLYNDLNKHLIISEHDPSTSANNSDKEWILFLNISFGEGKGKMEHINPAVPG